MLTPDDAELVAAGLHYLYPFNTVQDVRAELERLEETDKSPTAGDGPQPWEEPIKATGGLVERSEAVSWTCDFGAHWAWPSDEDPR